MKKKVLVIGILAIILATVTTAMTTQSKQDNWKRITFKKKASGKGFLIWGYCGAQPPFPGEDFFVGGPDAPDDPWYELGWYGTPEYYATLTDSSYKLMGRSEVVQEIPLREDLPGRTKIWGPPSMEGSGHLMIEWIHEDDEYELDVDIMTEHSPYTWVGSPGNTEWRFFGTGGPLPHPELAFISYQFTGTLNDYEVAGYLNTYSWPDVMFVNIYIASSENDDFIDARAEIIWLNKEPYSIHSWLANWLWFDIGLEDLDGAEVSEVWFPPADTWFRKVIVR